MIAKAFLTAVLLFSIPIPVIPYCLYRLGCGLIQDLKAVARR